MSCAMERETQLSDYISYFNLLSNCADGGHEPMLMDNQSVSYGFTDDQREELRTQKIMCELITSPQIVDSPQLNLEYSAGCGVDRCKRANGKNWRCPMRCAAPHQKYCEHHLRSRKRPSSRKPVEKKHPKLVNRDFGSPAMEREMGVIMSGADQGWSEMPSMGFENPTSDIDVAAPVGLMDAWSSISSLGVGSALPTIHENFPTLFGEMGEEDQVQQQATEEFGYCGDGSPMHWEDFGGPLAEAMCMGPPAVSTTALSSLSEVPQRTSFS